MTRLYFFCVFILLSFPSPSWSQNWTDGADKEAGPTEPENRIIKWCKEGSDSIRYASANLKIPGYQPCGKLTASTSCDAGGTRIISKSSQRPRDHRDCDGPARIFIMNHKDGSTMDDSSLTAPSTEVDPLSATELTELKRDMDKAKKDQEENDPLLKLENMMMDMVNQYSVSTPKRRSRARRKNKRRYRQKKPEELLENILKQVDPKTLEALMKMFQP